MFWWNIQDPFFFFSFSFSLQQQGRLHPETALLFLFDISFVE
jgi:hypothetical protein